MSVNVTTLEVIEDESFSYNSTESSSLTPLESGYTEEDLMKLALFAAVRPLIDVRLYIIWAIGIPSNILSLLTACRMRPFSSSTWFIAALALVDLLYLILDNLVFYIVIVVFNTELSNEICGLYFYLGTVLIHFASWLIVAITVERLIAVWMPLKVSTICTPKRAKIFTALCPLCLLALNVPFTYIPSSFSDPSGSWSCAYHPDYYDFMSKWTFVDHLIYAFIPLPVLVVSNVMIIVGLRMSTKRKQRLMNKTDADGKDPNRGITVMLVTVSLVAVVLLTPNTVFFVYFSSTQSNYRATAEEYATYQFLSAFVFFLSSLNHCMNFGLYVVSGRRFRQVFLTLICCRSEKAQYKQPLTGITTLSSKQLGEMTGNPSATTTASISELVT